MATAEGRKRHNFRLTAGRAANSRSAASHTYMFRDRRSLTPGIYRRRSAAEVPTYNRIDFHGATPERKAVRDGEQTGLAV